MSCYIKYTQLCCINMLKWLYGSRQGSAEDQLASGGGDSYRISKGFFTSDSSYTLELRR